MDALDLRRRIRKWRTCPASAAFSALSLRKASNLLGFAANAPLPASAARLRCARLFLRAEWHRPSPNQCLRGFVAARHAGLACGHRLQVYFLALHPALRLVYPQRHAGPRNEPWYMCRLGRRLGGSCEAEAFQLVTQGVAHRYVYGLVMRRWLAGVIHR